VFFTELHLHEQLITKIKISGKNAIFGLRIKLNLGGQFITGIATGTAVCLASLPLPRPLKVEKTNELLTWLQTYNRFYTH
jgi:hypothetical protein